MLRKILFIFSIMSIIILTGCNKSIIEKDLLTNDSEQINIGKVTINNQDKQKYEILDYDECKDVEFIDTCKFVVFEDETAYIIMSYNIADSFRYLADLVEQKSKPFDDLTSSCYKGCMFTAQLIYDNHCSDERSTIIQYDKCTVRCKLYYS